MSAKRKNIQAAPPAPEVRSAPPRPARVAALAALLLLAGLWAYSNSFDGILVLDDVRAIALNPSIRSLDTALSPPPASTVAGRPVANLTFAINYQLAPDDTRDAFLPDPAAGEAGVEAVRRNLRGYHAVNLAIHLAAGLVLFGVLRRTFARVARPPFDVEGEGWSLGGPSGLAFGAALLWVVHPLHTESVSYLVQRVESLMGLCYLATVYAGVRAFDGRNRAWWAVAAVAACGLGMATKEVMVTAPLAVMLWDVLIAPRPLPRWRRWFWLGLASTWIVFAALVWFEHRGASLGSDAGDVWRYLLTQSAVIVHYLRLAFVPSPLVFLYTWPLASSILDVWPQALVVAAVAVLTAAGLMKRTPFAFAGAWFLLVLAPTSSVIPILTEVAAEHRMYLPLAAVAASVVYVGAMVGHRILAARADTSSRLRSVPAVAGALLLAAACTALVSATRDRNLDYRSDVALWGDTVAKEPENQRARTAFGMALFGQHRWQEAETQLLEAVRLAPGDAVARVRLGGLLASERRFTEAIGHLEEAARATSRQDAQVLSVLAAALAQQGRFLPAAAVAEEARQAALAQGQPELAAELAQRAAAFRARAGAF